MKTILLTGACGGIGQALARALELTDALTADERRVRQGLVSRQVTIR